MMKNSEYKANYVFGKSKIPLVTATHGPFTPRSLRFSRYQSPEDTTRGSLNWNIMVSETAPGAGNTLPLPNLTDHANAGHFDEMPVPDGAPGVIIVSFGALIEKVILPHAFKSYQIEGANFIPDANEAVAKLQKDITLTDNTTYYTHFGAGNTKVYAVPDKNHIRVDYELDELEQMKVVNPPYGGQGSTPPPNWNYSPRRAGSPFYKVTWSGYFTFTIENNELKVHYTQDDHHEMTQTDDDTGMRVLLDIFSLGFNELTRYLDHNKLAGDIDGAIANDGLGVLGNILSCVELPGESAFEFDTVDMIDVGLRVHLKYA